MRKYSECTNRPLTQALHFAPVPRREISNDGILPVSIRHLAGLTCESIHVWPNHLSGFTEEVPNARSVGTSVVIPTPLFMITNMNRRDDESRHVVVEHMHNVGVVLGKVSQQVRPVDTVRIVA
jgi:hypothetical protein